MSQWRTFSSLNVQFHLYVPVSAVDSARRLCMDHQIVTTEVWAYHAIGDQIRFTPVQRAPQPADAKAPKAEPREPAAAAKPVAPKTAPPSRAVSRTRTARPVSKTAGRSTARAKPRAAAARTKSSASSRRGDKAASRKSASASKAMKRK